MTIRLRCTNEECGKLFTAKQSLAGKRIRCSGCGTVLTVPAPEDDRPEDDRPEEAFTPRPPARKQVPVDDDDDHDKPSVRPAAPARKRGGILTPLLALLFLGAAAAAGYFGWMHHQATQELAAARLARPVVRPTTPGPKPAEEPPKSSEKDPEPKPATPAPAGDLERALYARQIELAQTHLTHADPASAYRTLLEGPENLRGWEWHHLRLAAENLADARRTPFGIHGFRAGALRNDGVLVLFGNDRTLQFWAPGEERRKKALPLKGFMGVANVAALSADASVLATGEPPAVVLPGAKGAEKPIPQEEVVRLWDARTGEPLPRVKAKLPRGGTPLLALSPDGRHLALAILLPGSPSQDLQVIDTRSGEAVGTVPDLAGLRHVGFTPDGKGVALQYGGPQTFWVEVAETINVKTPEGKEVQQSVTRKVPKTMEAPHGAKIVDLAGKDVVAFENADGKFQRLVFRPDGKLAVAAGVETHLVKKIVPVTVMTTETRVRTVQRKNPEGKVEQVQEQYTVNVPTTVYKEVTECKEGAGKAGLRRWDAATGKELSPLENLAGVPGAVAFHPGGSRMLVALQRKLGGPALAVLDAADGDPLALLPLGRTQDYPPQTLLFSPDGKHLAGWQNWGGGPFVWSAGAGRVLAVDDGHRAPLRHVAFSPDGKLVASLGADGVARLRPLAGDEILVRTDPSLGVGFHAACDISAGPPPGALAFSRDGRCVTNAEGLLDFRPNFLRVWDTATGKAESLPKGFDNLLALSSDGTRRAAAQALPPDGPGTPKMKVFDAAGKDLCTLADPGNWPVRLTFSPDGSRLAGIHQGWGPKGPRSTVHLWDAVGGKLLLTHEGAAGIVAFSPDGKVLASATPAHFGAPIAPGPVPSPAAERGSISHQVAFASADLKGLLSMAQGPVPVPQPKGGPPPAPPTPATVKLFDTTAGKEIGILKDLKHPPQTLHFAPNGKTLALRGGGSIDLFEVGTGKVLWSGSDVTAGPVFTEDGRMVCALGGEFAGPGARPLPSAPLASLPGEDGTEFVLQGPPPPMPGGANGARILVLDAASGKELQTFRGHRQRVTALAVRGDRAVSAAGEEGLTEVKVWNTRSGQELFTFRGHGGAVRTLALSPDGTLAASGGADGTVKVWRVGE